MTALQLFKQANVWESIKDTLDSDYVKYPLVGAGVGGLGLGGAAALGNGPEDETPEAKRKRILSSALKGAGLGGVAGLSGAAIKNNLGFLSGGKGEGSDGGQKSPGRQWSSPEKSVTTLGGGALGGAVGYNSAEKSIAEQNAKIDISNKDGRGIVAEINKLMAGGEIDKKLLQKIVSGGTGKVTDFDNSTAKLETILRGVHGSQEFDQHLDMLAKTNPGQIAAIDKLKEHVANKGIPQSYSELLSRLPVPNAEMAPVAAGHAAKVMQHMGKGPSPLELEGGLQSALGSTGSFTPENLGDMMKQTTQHAQKGFIDAPHLSGLNKAMIRGKGTGLGALIGGGIPYLYSTLGTAMSSPVDHLKSK